MPRLNTTTWTIGEWALAFGGRQTTGFHQDAVSFMSSTTTLEIWRTNFPKSELQRLRVTSRELSGWKPSRATTVSPSNKLATDRSTKWRLEQDATSSCTQRNIMNNRRVSIRWPSNDRLPSRWCFVHELDITLEIWKKLPKSELQIVISRELAGLYITEPISSSNLATDLLTKWRLEEDAISTCTQRNNMNNRRVSIRWPSNDWLPSRCCFVYELDNHLGNLENKFS